ncbi:hypothetical protein [Halobellus rubicundus]|uniref:Uncharacterized protein n=1 Tax=Halobellus rubicundus TaxID=2996466 RepID=A0ABD5MCT0_9EURY
MALREPAASVVRSVDGDRAVALLESVYEHDLPPEIQELVAEYGRLDGDRSTFLWKWIHHLAPKNVMPFVDESDRDTVAINNTMLVIFVTLLDDLIEKRRDYETFDAITSLVRLKGWSDGTAFGHGPGRTDGGASDGTAIDEPYAAFAVRVWDTLLDRLERSPEFDRYAPLFRFDVSQIVTSIEYSMLVIEHPELASVEDLERYESHNMGMHSFLDIDLMYAPASQQEDLPVLRDAVEIAQEMARIGNWLSTWEREVREGDVSSGVVVSALERGIVDVGDLPDPEDPDPAAADRVISRINDHDVESALLSTWNDKYRRLVALDREADTVDLGPFIDGTEEVLRYYLASRWFT